MSQKILYQIAGVTLVVGAVLDASGNLIAPQGGARAAVASWTYYPSAFAVLLGGLLVMASGVGWRERRSTVSASTGPRLLDVLSLDRRR